MLLGIRAFPILVFLCAMYMIPYAMYVRSSYAALWGRVALSVAFVTMSIFMLLNYWQATVVLGSVENPFLMYDARSFYLLSHDLYHDRLGQNSPVVPYMGYPLFLSCWLRAGVVDIAYPIIVNIGLMLSVLVMIGRCVWWVIDDNAKAQQVSGYAMMLTAFIPGVLGMSALLAKEPFIMWALVLCVNALYAVKRRYKLPKYALLLLVALLVLATCRATYIYVLGLYFLIIWGYDFKRRDIIPFLMIVVVMGAMLYMGIYYSWWGDVSFIVKYVSDKSHHSSFFCGESQEPLRQLMGDYGAYPLWQRLLLLPLSVGVQFMIPFPFSSTTPYDGLPISMLTYHRMSYLWYAAAIPMLCYYLFYCWRKKGGGIAFDLLAIISAVAYCIPAFITAGSVSRYAYCFVPFLSIMGGYVVHRIIKNHGERKKVGVFTLLYIVLITAALFIGANPHLIV